MVNLFHVEENDLKAMTVGMLALNRCTLLTTGNVPAELKHILIHLKAEMEKVFMDHLMMGLWHISCPEYRKVFLVGFHCLLPCPKRIHK